MSEKPKYLSDLSGLNLWGIWVNFLWGLEKTDAWKTIKWSMVDGKKIPGKEESNDMTKQGTFLTVMPRKILNYERTKEDVDFVEDITPEKIFAIEDPTDIFQKIIYEDQLKKFNKDPDLWRKDYFGVGKQEEWRFDFIATCENELFGSYLKKVVNSYANEVKKSLIKALRAEQVEEAFLDNAIFNLRLVHPEDYFKYGYDRDKLFNPNFSLRYQFASDEKPSELYRWRGLDMSYSHKELAKALYIRGFMFASEAPVFPQDREDKSYIRPDLIVLHKGISLIVEVDGPIHDEPNQELKDFKRNAMFKQEGFETMRFKAEEALSNPHECVSKIVTYFDQINRES